jgi:GDP-L-fucose synthase
MSILVTGSTGLAGSAVIDLLEKKSESFIGHSSKDVDLRRRDKTFEYMQDIRPSTVICCAARAGGIMANLEAPVEFLSDNLLIQTNVLDAAFAAGVERLVFLGSTCIYPQNCKQPMKEEYLLTGTPEPSTRPYALAKHAGIELVNSYRRQFGKRWISILPTNLYGPNDNYDPSTSHVMASLIRKFVEATKTQSEVTVWGSGNAKREFLHSSDLAEAILFLLENYDDPTPINVGAGEEVSIRDLVSLVSSLTGFKGDITWDQSKPDGALRKFLCIDRIQGLGWQPKTSLVIGIENAVHDFRSHSDSKFKSSPK